MALLLGLLLAVVSAVADPVFPALTGRVVDNAALLSPAQEEELTVLLKAHEEKTTNQVVVVTLKSLEGYEIADYGYRLGRHWGIGQKGKDNGVLLIVAPKEGAVRIEVGYGLEGALTDKSSHDIIQEVILPRFKSGDVAGGIRSGAAAILAVLEGGTPAALPGNARAETRDNSGPINFGFFVIMVLGTAIGGQSQKVRFSLASVTSAAVAVILLLLDEALLFVMLLALIAFMLVAFGGSRSGHRGGGSGGSWGGGFSGGGGSFGGGGASGRW